MIVVVGGGIAGLTAAWLLRRKYPSVRVIVVERSPRLGGLLTTFEYGRFGHFDCGMHWITETGVEEIDAFYLDLLPRQEWIVLEGARRDLSGLFYSGRLQQNTQFPDLRHVERERYLAYLGDFFANLNRPEVALDGSLLGHARSRFGTLIADTVIEPIASKIHGVDADQLDPMARFLPLLDRVVLFDEDVFSDLMRSSELRARLAFPEQRRLPLSYSSGRRSWYPRRYGIGRVIDALTARLRDEGVELLTGARVLGLERSSSLIRRITIETSTAERRDIGALKQLVWTGDAFPLADLLGLLPAPRPAPIKRTVIVSMLLRTPPRMGGLYCFFCADAPHSTYRVTDFSSFCPEASHERGYPISVELLANCAEAMDKTAYESRARREILAFGLIDSPEDVVFAFAESLPNGFPSMARDSMRSVEAVRDAIDAQKIINLLRGGILAKPNQFFQHDVLIDLYKQIQGL